jgi:hypothetical protein
VVSQENNAKFAIGLIDLGTVTTVFIPLLYTAGWSFAYHYFGHFHLGMQGLNIQKEYLFLYSFWVIKDQFYITIAAILILVLVYVGIRLLFRLAASKEQKFKPYIFQAIGLMMVPAAILGLFTLFYGLGDRTADSLYEKQTKGDFPSYPRVKVLLNEKAVKEVGAIAKEWSNGCYRLLLSNKEKLYIFFSGGYTEKIATEVIPQRQVRLVRVLPLYKSSEKCN